MTDEQATMVDSTIAMRVIFIVECYARLRCLLWGLLHLILILVDFIAVEELKSTLLRQRDITE